MASKSGSRKKSGSTPSGDAGNKDLIDGLENRIAVLENELRSKHQQAALDITERKHIVEKLAEKERFLSNVFECIQDGVCVLDKDMNILQVNPAMEKWYGRTTGKKCYQAYHGRSEPCEPCPSIRAIKEGSMQTGIVHDLKGWRELYAFPLINERGEVTGVIEHVRDIDERKRAEEALKLTQFATDNFRDSAIWLTPDGSIVYVNQEACESLGYSREELLSMHIWDIDPGYPQERLMELWPEKRQGLYTKFESVHVARDGRAFPVEITCSYTRYGDEEYLITFDRDITERKRAEEALRESEEKYRFLVENSKDVIWKIDLQGRWAFVSGNVERVTGYRPDEIMGKIIWDVIAPECRESLKEKLLKRMRGEDIPPYVTWLINKAGVRTPVEVAATSITDEGGRIVGVQGISRDITERMRAEEALRESEMKFRVLAETSPVAIFLYQGGKYVYVNPMAEALTGYSRDELLAGDAWEWIHPEYQELVKGRSRKRQMGEPLPNRYEVRYRAKDGREGWVDFAAGIIEYRGKPAGLAMAIDVSKRKQAEEALKEAKAHAELYVDLMGHDINNMNQISIGFLELARNIIEMNGRLGEDDIVLLDKATDALKDSSQLIDNVRKLQREKMGLYEPETIDIGIMVQDAVKQFHSIPGRDVKITCDITGQCVARANSLLKDVFINLIGNAVKHSRGNLSVNVCVSQVTDNGKAYCRVIVEDDGPGIPDTLKATLFDRLNLTTARAKGKGFGLCLIKMLVDDFNGKFWVEDRVNGDYMKGARFVVMLPAVEK